MTELTTHTTETLTLPAIAYATDSHRQDGWTAQRQADFVGHLADCGNVAQAAKLVSMGLSGAYAFRRTAYGCAFNLGWQAALILARHRLLDEMFARAIDGEDIVTEVADGFIRKRSTNYRLGLSLLDRVTPEHADLAVRTVVQDFDAFLEVIVDGGTCDDLCSFFTVRVKNRMSVQKLLSTLPLPEESAD
jgi:hypothetical protein